MEDVDYMATIADPLLACCLCGQLVQDAMQLTCLHNCCRQCFSTAESKGSSQGVGCGTCGKVTQAGSEQANGFIDREVQRYASIAESMVCGVCKGNGECNKAALVWCPACRYSLCGDCVAGHRRYNRQHVTQSLEELKSLEKVSSQALPSACPNHKKLLDIACLNCEQAKCTTCWIDCNGKDHKMHVLGEELFDSYVGRFVACISTMESELLLKSQDLKKPNSILQDTKAARNRHLEEITMRKRRVVDAIDMVYQEIECSTKNAYDDLEAGWEAEAADADRIASDLLDTRSYVRRLLESSDKCEILKQQKAVRERLSILSTELDSLSYRLATTMGEVKLEASLPESLEDIVRAWIGKPVLYSASSSPPFPSKPHVQQQQCFSFGAASVSVQLPFKCNDVALTKDGCSLLLATNNLGLIEFCSSRGYELSRWQPPKHSPDREDDALAVAALSDGRAAVSLRYSNLVVLLQRSKKGGIGGLVVAVSAGDAWTEDRRLDPLPWSAWCLSVYGDVLAASDCFSGPHLQLLSLGSGRRLRESELKCEYVIGSLAVTAEVVVTGSEDKVLLGSGRQAAYVLDAHGLAGSSDERLWRHVLSSVDDLVSICADTGGGCLYAVVCRCNKSRYRVSALSLADGSELRSVALSFESAVTPNRMSLSDEGALPAEQQQRSSESNVRGRVLLLAVLCLNRTTVTVHRSTVDVLQ